MKLFFLIIIFKSIKYFFTSCTNVNKYTKSRIIIIFLLYHVHTTCKSKNNLSLIIYAIQKEIKSATILLMFDV